MLLDPSAALRSPQSVSCPVESSAGAAVAGLCASSAVPIFGEEAALYSVDEPECESMDEAMGSVKGPVSSLPPKSCVVPSEAGFPPVSEYVVVIRNCVNVTVWTDDSLLKYLQKYCETYVLSMSSIGRSHRVALNRKINM